jgi:elongator complex protein 5
MTLLAAILSNPSRPNQPFFLFQSSTAQSSLPLLRSLIAYNTDGNNSRGLGHTLLFCFLYPPSALVVDATSQTLRVFDRLANVPGYTDNWLDPREEILSSVLAGETRYNCCRVPLIIQQH